MPSVQPDMPLIDVSRLKAESLNSLIDIFLKIAENSYSSSSSTPRHLLILDPELSKYINKLTTFTNLKQQTGIDNVLLLDQAHQHQDFIQTYQSVVFLSQDSLSTIDVIANLIKTKILPFHKANSDQQISIVFSTSNKKFDQFTIETLNLKGDVELYNWESMVPLAIDDDLIVLNSTGNQLSDIFVSGSIASVVQLAQTLLKLVILSNFKLRFTNVYLKGVLAKLLYQNFDKNFQVYLQDELNLKQAKQMQEIDDVLFLDKHTFYNKQCDLVVLERSVDLITPLLTQLTYAGLIDETFGIDFNEIKIKTKSSTAAPNSVSNNTAAAEPSSQNFQKFIDDDPLFKSLQNLNFSQVGPILNSKAKILQNEFDKRHGAKDINQIKQFVDKLNDLTAEQNLIKDHTFIAESILKKVKEEERSAITDEQVQTSHDDTNDEEEEDDEEDTYFSMIIDLEQQILSNNLDNTTTFSKLFEFMYTYKPSFNDFMKLVLLTNIVKKGFRQKEYQNLKKEIVENYGFDKFPILQKMEQLKLFHMRESSNELNLFSVLETATSSAGSSSTPKQQDLLQDAKDQHLKICAQQIKNFGQLNYYLNLIPSNDTDSSKDPDFVLPGFVPVAARLIESIYSRAFVTSSALQWSPSSGKPGWAKMNDTLGKYFHESTSSFKEYLLVPEKKKALFSEPPPVPISAEASSIVPKKPKHRDVEYIVVAMIGGITYAELSAIRFIINKINTTLGYNKKLLVVTDKVIKSDDIIDMCRMK